MDPSKRLLRFADLKAAGILNNWHQVRRLQESSGFPPGFLLSPGCRVWDALDIDAWIKARKEAGSQGQAA